MHKPDGTCHLPLRYRGMENDGREKQPSRPSAARSRELVSAAAEASLTLTELMLVQLRESGALPQDEIMEGLESALQAHQEQVDDFMLPDDLRAHHQRTAEIIRSILVRQGKGVR